MYFFQIFIHYFLTVVSETKCLSFVCTNVQSIGGLQKKCSGICMFNVATIFVQ